MIAKELDLSSDPFSTLGRLHPLAVFGGYPNRPKESQDPTLGVGAVMLAHDGFDGLGGFFTMVEWHLGKVVVNHVRLDDAVHKVPADETKVTVDGGGSTAGEGPRSGIVVRECGIGVLEVCDPY